MTRQLARLLPSLALILTACASTSECGVVEAAKIPLDVHNNVPLVTANIDGVPATLIADTGAQGTILAEAAAQRLKLRIEFRRTGRIVGLGGMAAAVGARVRTFSLSGLEIPLPWVATGPVFIPTVGSVSPDGIVGVDVFSQFEVDLNLPDHQVTLYAGRTCPKGPPWNINFVELPPAPPHAGALQVRVQLDKHPIAAVLDTAAQVTAISRSWAVANGLSQSALEQDRSLRFVSPATSGVLQHVHRFATLDIGSDFMRDPLIAVVDLPQRDIAMVLGSNYLAHRRLWLSYATHRVFVAQ